MKTKFYYFLILSMFSLGLQAQQLPNSGFENWTRKIITEPNGFYTSNSMMPSGTGSVTQTTAYHGQYGVKIQTVKSGNDTIQGMLIIGTPGNQGINGGIPFTGTPDSITGYANFDIQPNDTASFIVAFKKNGSFISQAIMQFTGIQSGYKRFSIPTNLNSNIPDSLIAFITSSRMDPPRIPGSMLTLDSINFLHSTQQLPNNDFENWTTLDTPEDPVSWGTYAGQYPLNNLPVLVTKTTDKHSGNYAVKLISTTGTMPPPFGTGSPNEIIVGTLQLNLIDGYRSTKYPFAFRPDSLAGFIKGTVASQTNNMNMVFVQLYNKGNNIGQVYYAMNNSLINYARFSTPVYYSSELVPDSMAFYLFAGNPSTYYSGNEFYVDDLLFVYNAITGIKESSLKPVFSVYPIPVGNELTIQSENGINCKIRIYDMVGKIIFEGKIERNLLKLNTTGFSSGIYMSSIFDSSGQQLKSGRLTKK